MSTDVRERIVGAGLLAGVGLAVVYAWSTWALPVARMIAESPRHRVQLALLIAVPLALAAACLLIGAVRGLRAVAGLGLVARWSGRAAFGACALLGALVAAAAVVLLTG